MIDSSLKVAYFSPTYFSSGLIWLKCEGFLNFYSGNTDNSNDKCPLSVMHEIIIMVDLLGLKLINVMHGIKVMVYIMPQN